MSSRALIDFKNLKKTRFSTIKLTEAEIEPKKEVQNIIKVVSNESNQINLSTSTNITASDDEYKHLLDRIIDIIAEKNPDILGNEKKFSLPVIQIQKVGTRSVWINFKEVCDLIKRPIDHVYNFFVKELGTEASLGGENQFSLKGKYNSTKIEALIAKYAKEYVRCPNCKSFDTIITKNNSTRLQMLECNFCNTKRSVAKQA